MRFNMFAQKGGSAYGALVCSSCNKSVTFELEQLADLSVYGEGARVLSVLGSPKPPDAERHKPDGDSDLSDQTL